MKHLILKSAASGHQKVLLIGFAVLFFLWGGITTVWLLFWSFGLLPEAEVSIGDFVLVILFLGSFYLFAIALTRVGLTIEENGLSQSRFLFGKRLKAIELDINGYCDVSILRFNMAQKVAMGAAPNPDQAVGFVEYRICLLNENHSKRKLVFTAKDQVQAKYIVTELANSFGLKYTNYNPPRSAKRRR